MTQAPEERLIAELLHRAAGSAPVAPTAEGALRRGRRRLLRRRALRAAAGAAALIALVSVAPQVLPGPADVTVRPDSSPTGVMPTALDCSDRGGRSSGGIADWSDDRGDPMAPAEQAMRHAHAVALDTRFPGLHVSAVGPGRLPGIPPADVSAVALADSAGLTRALITFQRARGGWQLVGTAECA